MGRGPFRIFSYFQRRKKGLVFQLVDVFEDQLADGLAGAGSVNLEADLRAFRDGGGHLLHRLGRLGGVLEGLLEAGAILDGSLGRVGQGDVEL